MVLERFRDGFGDHFGTQNRLKIHWKCAWFFYWFFNSFDFGRILASFWLPFGSQNRLQDSSRLLLGHGVPPQGRPRAFGASQSFQKSILRDPKAPKMALEIPRAPKMNPWTLTEPVKSAPGSNSDPSKRPEARRRPRGPPNRPQVTPKLSNRSFKSIKLWLVFVMFLKGSGIYFRSQNLSKTI